MKISTTGTCTARLALRGVLIVGVTLVLSGCGVFSWIGSRFSSDKSESATAPAPAPAARAPAATSTLGAADPADPVPRDEPLHASANKWYGANGRLYRPITDDRTFKERGKASVIGADQEGKPTASGESFAPRAMTGAHPVLPIPSYVRVTDLRTGKSAVVRINDRGAYERDEAIAISAGVAQKIGLAGNDEVEVERITPAEIAAMPATRAAAAAPAPPPVPPPPPVAVVAPQTARAAPAEPTPLPPQAVEVPAPAPTPVAPPAPAPVAAAPVVPVASAVAPAAAPVRPAPVAAAPRASSRTPGAQSAVTGRWSVQVAAFATESMAESTRARVAQLLAQDAPNLVAGDRTPRVERYGNRSYVLLGDFTDRDSAEALAGRLRAVLRQDVVVDRH